MVPSNGYGGPMPEAPAPLDPPESFLADAARLGVEFDPGDVGRLGAYLAMLLEQNEHMNLTGVTDRAEVWTRHVLDSLSLVPFLADLRDGARVIDVGSGGGLPGVPLAICLPRLRFTLLEATGKKAAFLRRVVEALALSNAEVLGVRAEIAGQDRGERTSEGRKGAHRESYDAVVARAVGPLNVLAELTVPFAKAAGRILLMKGRRADAELTHAAAALRELRAVHEGTHDTPTGRVVVLTKGAATPRTYPRAPGEPKRAPLGGVMPADHG